MNVFCRQAVKGCRVSFSLSFSRHKNCKAHLRKCSLPRYNKWMRGALAAISQCCSSGEMTPIKSSLCLQVSPQTKHGIYYFPLWGVKTLQCTHYCFACNFYFWLNKSYGIWKIVWEFYIYEGLFCFTHIGNVKVSSLITSLPACHFLTTKVVLLHDPSS